MVKDNRLLNEDELVDQSLKKGRGKRKNQKIKPYAVLQFLLRYTDEDHVASAQNIVAYLQEHGINRKSYQSWYQVV